MRIIKRIFLALLIVVLVFVGYVFIAMKADVPESRLTLPAPLQGAPSDPRPVLIFGATRNTGLELAKLLHERGESVVAFVRETSDLSGLESLDAETLVGDAMDLPSVRAAVASRPFRAIVTTVGCLPCDPPVDFVANRNIFDAAKDAGIQKVLMVSTIGAGNSRDATPLLSRWIIGKVLPLKTQAEDHLRASIKDYIVIRPGGLSKNEATGTGVLSEDPSTFGFIDRAELARLMLACLDHQTCNGKTLSAIDANKPRFW